MGLLPQAGSPHGAGRPHGPVECSSVNKWDRGLAPLPHPHPGPGAGEDPGVTGYTAVSWSSLWIIW